MRAVQRKSGQIGEGEVTPTVRERIEAALLPTWQTGAAIAMHVGIPAKTAVSILRRHANAWGLENRKVRVDGHNEVNMYRRRHKVLVLGVLMPLDGDEEEV